jgi:hypothetical protein
VTTWVVEQALMRRGRRMLRGYSSRVGVASFLL